MKERKTGKEKLVDSLRKSIVNIEKKLAKFLALNKEYQELKDALKALTGETHITPKPPETDPTDLYYNPDNTTPNSVTGLNQLTSLPVRFSLDDVVIVVGSKQQGYQTVAAWKRSNKIKTVSRGVYEKV